MKIKLFSPKITIVTVIAITTCALIIICSIRSCSAAERRIAIKNSIISVLIQDQAASIGVSSHIEYHKKQREIIPRGCPEDFQDAYTAHQNAWGKAATAETGFFNFEEKRKASTEIFTTWMEVLRIAEKYGVDTSIYRGTP